MKGNKRMSNNQLRIRNNAVRGSIMVVLLCTLFTMMSFTAFAYNQGLQSHTVTSLVNTPSGGGGPAGTADLQWDPQTKALTATVHLSGLQPGSSYANHIHQGDCSPTEGKMLYPFNNVVTDAAGNGTATTIVNNITNGIPASGWHVTVHSGPTAQDSPLLCGDVVNQNGANLVSVQLSLVPPTP
jgi:hypothetical protein